MNPSLIYLTFESFSLKTFATSILLVSNLSGKIGYKREAHNNIILSFLVTASKYLQLSAYLVNKITFFGDILLFYY